MRQGLINEAPTDKRRGAINGALGYLWHPACLVSGLNLGRINAPSASSTVGAPLMAPWVNHGTLG